MIAPEPPPVMWSSYIADYWPVPDDGTPSAIWPTASITIWHDSDWPRLVRGQRVIAWRREWRVTEIETSPDGDETYQLEPAEIVGARIEAQRQADRLTFLPPVV